MAILNTNILKAILYSIRHMLPDGTPRWGIAPVFHWGVHGIGKTEMAAKLGRQLGFDFIHTIIPSNSDPGDIGGVPFLDPSGKYFERKPPKWAYDANQAKRALIIIDEYGDAPPSIQAPLQRVVNELMVGDTPLGGHVRFLCFGNPVEISTNGYPLSMPSANRGGHVEISYDQEEINAWRRWLINDGGMQWKVDALDGDQEEQRVLKEWPNAYAKACGLVSGFVGSRRKLLVVPKRESPEASRAHVTPRTMHMATEALAAGIVHNLDESDSDEAIEMFIGEAMAMEFAAWRSENSLPDFEAFLDGKIKWAHDETRPDITMALLDGCSSLVKSGGQTKANKARATKLWNTMEPIAENEPDLVWTAADTLCNNGFRRVCPAARKVMVSLRTSYNILSDMDAA